MYKSCAKTVPLIALEIIKDIIRDPNVTNAEVNGENVTLTVPPLTLITISDGKEKDKNKAQQQKQHRLESNINQ